MIFTDTMQIPVGAPHAFTAQKMMDFVYEPEIQAKITASVNYVPPVKGAREVLEKSDPEIAENELIFPDLSKCAQLQVVPAGGGSGDRGRLPARDRRVGASGSERGPA